MKGLKVPLRDAQKVKEILKSEGLLDNGKLALKGRRYIIFPVKGASKIKKISAGQKTVQKKFKTRVKKGSLKEEVCKKLTKKEADLLKTSFDVVGTIAILEVEEGLEKREKMLAKSVMKLNPRIKTVLKKEGGHTGTYRRQKMRLLAGDDTKESVHLENGVKIMVNVETVYFSPRLSHERKRVAEQVKKGEKVLVMFSGAGPYVCVIAKKTKAKEVVGIEINPEGHRYAIENLLLNKIRNARLYLGDVNEIVPRLREKFDRIVMPLPKTAEGFLPAALSAAKKGTEMHFYDFLEEKDIPLRAVEKIKKACAEKKKKCRILGYVKCGQHAPRVFRVCIDFKIV